MRNSLKVNEISINKNLIIYKYSFGENWKKWMSLNTMYVKYCNDISKTPKSIAIIPLLCNLLPIAWLFDLTIELDEIDEMFYNSIPKIKDGYSKMYPNLKFLGNIKVNKIIKNKFEGKKSAVMFSGGVDAFSTLITNISSNPDLITVFGADVDISDTKGIFRVNELNKKTAEILNLNYQSIESDFRKIINYNNLSYYVRVNYGYEWWHEFQQGIGLLGLTAPLSYINKYSTIYIASSFTNQDIGKYTCASDPLIDNHFKHSNSITIHDGFENDRQKKIKIITDYINEKHLKLNIRVCWVSKGGKNCCRCEKCYRTMMGIIAAGGNLKDLGFDDSNKSLKRMKRYLNHILKYDSLYYGFVVANYTPIQKVMKENKKLKEEYKWFIDLKIGKKKPNIKFNIIKFITRVKNKIRYYLKKAFK